MTEHLETRFILEISPQRGVSLPHSMPPSASPGQIEMEVKEYNRTDCKKININKINYSLNLKLKLD